MEFRPVGDAGEGDPDAGTGRAEIRRHAKGNRIALYELQGTKPLAAPKALSAEEARRIAREHYDRWMPSAEQFLTHAHGRRRGLMAGSLLSGLQ